MPVTIEEIQSHVQVYFRYRPAERKKFCSPSNDAEIVRRIETFGVTPSETAVYRALKELVEEGAISRIDGGNAETDAAGVAAAKQAHIDRLASVPLTDADYINFAGMNEGQIRDAFYSDPVFAARYKFASAKWGFRIPEQINQMTVDLGQWKDLDARAYNAIPAQKVVQLYRSDKFFRAAVDKMIAEGRI